MWDTIQNVNLVLMNIHGSVLTFILEILVLAEVILSLLIRIKTGKDTGNDITLLSKNLMTGAAVKGIAALVPFLFYVFIDAAPPSIGGTYILAWTAFLWTILQSAGELNSSIAMYAILHPEATNILVRYALKFLKAEISSKLVKLETEQEKIDKVAINELFYKDENSSKGDK